MIKKFLRDNFRSLYELYKFYQLFKNLKFSGWGMTTNTSPPWVGNSNNKTFKLFEETNEKLINLIRRGEFNLTQFNSESVYETLNELRYRHYIVSFTSLLAFNSTKSRNIAEFGVCDGLTVFFSINKYN